MEATTQAYSQIALQNRRDELILTHLPMVRHVIGKLVGQLPRGVDMENLEAAGTLGLVEAASNFDEERGSQFKSYAYLRIRGAVLDELRRNCPLPQHMLERIGKVRKVYRELQPPVTVEALAAATGFSTDDVAECLEAVRLTRAVSWDNACGHGDGRLDDRQQPPDALMERAEQKELLARAITALSERERLVVTLYYMEDLRLKEIGVLLSLSESRVSRVLQAALFHIGEFFRAGEAA